MSPPPTFDDLSPAVRTALQGRGFTELTPVQEAVLDPALAGRDLRIFSQTGSGKTVAVGLAIAPDLERLLTMGAAPPNPRSGPPSAPPSDEAPAKPPPSRALACPFALVVAPTRELAAQIGKELSWLFAPIGAQVAAVTGGASYPRELAALRRGPSIVVGTPGRLIDHLGRGSVDLASLAVLVLDEADQMLDMGFRDELDAILEKTPEARRTLLLSATFPREVQRLADRCQRDPVVAAASGAGEVNENITHVAHIVLGEQRDAALRNLLLMAPGERALVFVRTREGAADLADQLADAGLPARAIHGDLEQRDRTRTLDAFRSGAVTTLVATDVAARGLDVPDVTRVIHADPPGDAEVYTHRSGRTARAGKKGQSIVLIPPGMRERVKSILRRAGVEATWSAAPSAPDVLRAADERLATELLATPEAPPDAPADTGEPRLRALAQRLLAARDPVALVTALLTRVHHAGPCPPAEVSAILPPSPRADRAPHTMPPPRGRPVYATGHGPSRGAPQGEAGGVAPGFVPFRINWGERQGADPRRLLALVCRRGGIRGSDVGTIRIGVTASTFEVGAGVARDFEQAVKKPDTRDPRIRIEPATRGAAAPAREEGQAAPAARPQREEGYTRPAARPHREEKHAPPARPHREEKHAPPPAGSGGHTAPKRRRVVG